MNRHEGEACFSLIIRLHRVLRLGSLRKNASCLIINRLLFDLRRNVQRLSPAHDFQLNFFIRLRLRNQTS